MRSAIERKEQPASTDELRRQLHTLGEELGELRRLARGAARGKVEEGRTAVLEAEERLFDGVRARPGQSLLVAAGVGALLGLLFGRR